jgi:hypothetical protein
VTIGPVRELLGPAECAAILAAAVGNFFVTAIAANRAAAK